MRSCLRPYYSIPIPGLQHIFLYKWLLKRKKTVSELVENAQRNAGISLGFQVDGAEGKRGNFGQNVGILTVCMGKT